ncbi:hypothetical protein PPL_06327 [Heterostelium album PN500]|uniref:Uncharacterized protein n=1 Tax=Heterostelium pallidum (strain ATCC 26659 / Pp 5 / PN500) TaxID=670386 RepID=D3BCU9_HETP5|nr:hypothetical protein PPL_06327 [Heterostelium album PN500]EFA80741.1 hypothetical protein PPL_06327 [Heterostelium album PN500]|eukprot:XP_020432861.1 hypothetical protein PPL_06327 [Heterostelium album PN500]
MRYNKNIHPFVDRISLRLQFISWNLLYAVIGNEHLLQLFIITSLFKYYTMSLLRQFNGVSNICALSQLYLYNIFYQMWCKLKCLALED